MFFRFFASFCGRINAVMRENSHSCFSPFSPAGFIRTGVAVLFSAVLAGCAGGGGFGGTADAGNSPNSIANPVEVASRPISDQERRKVAEAVSQLNFRGAADVAPENVGVSRSAAILNVNPFAAAAESAEAPMRAESRKMGGYKAFEVAVPAENPNMTVAVWISETPPEDGGLPEKPGKKLLYLRLQVFISVGNIPLLKDNNVVELESEVIVVEERRPDPPSVVEPETGPVSPDVTHCDAGGRLSWGIWFLWRTVGTAVESRRSMALSGAPSSYRRLRMTACAFRGGRAHAPGLGRRAASGRRTSGSSARWW